MKTLILTGYHETMKAIGEATTPRKLAWAMQHGYSFHRVEHFGVDSHPAWQKLPIALRNFNGGRIHWMDADMVITNPRMPLPPISTDHVVTASLDWMADATSFTTGAFSVNCAHPQANALFERFLRYGRQHPNVYWRGQLDQEAMQAIAAESPELFNIVPRRVYAAVPKEIQETPEPWQEGDLVAHLTGVSDEQGMEWMRTIGKNYL